MVFLVLHQNPDLDLTSEVGLEVISLLEVSLEVRHQERAATLHCA